MLMTEALIPDQAADVEQQSLHDGFEYPAQIVLLPYLDKIY
jgi:hypothetical protein